MCFFNEECENPTEIELCCLYEGVAFVTYVANGQAVRVDDSVSRESEWIYVTNLLLGLTTR